MITESMAVRLSRNPLKRNLIHHPFFDLIDTQPLSRETVSTFLGQWWHPLHYFPTFLSRTIAVVPALEMKTAISIDDALLQEADETAERMGLSRSRLFALAVGDFLQKQRREQMRQQPRLGWTLRSRRCTRYSNPAKELR